jgi:hypothetical protein
MKKANQFKMKSQITFTNESKQLFLVSAAFRMLPNLAPYSALIPSEDNFMKIYRKLSKGNLRLLAKIFNLKENKNISLKVLLLENRSLLAQIILTVLQNVPVNIYQLKNVSYIILLRGASVKENSLQKLHLYPLMPLNLFASLWITIFGYWVCHSYLYYNYATQTYLRLKQDFSILLIIKYFLLLKTIFPHSSLTLLFRKMLINVFYTHLLYVTLINKVYFWSLLKNGRSYKGTILLHKYTLNIKYFFNSLIIGLVPYSDNIHKVSLTTIIIQPTERYPREFYLANTRSPQLDLNIFKNASITMYRRLNLDDYYRNALTQEFVLRITFVNSQDFQLNPFSMPIVDYSVLMTDNQLTTNSPYDFEII